MQYINEMMYMTCHYREEDATDMKFVVEFVYHEHF